MIPGVAEHVDGAAARQADAAGPDGWRATLRCSRQGVVFNTFGNLCKILRHAPPWAGELAYNEMLLRPTLGGRALSDGDIGQLREQIERDFEISPALDNLQHALITVAQERRFHPVAQYLRGLPTWDGTPRIAEVIGQVLRLGRGQRRDLARKMFRKWCVAAATRALEPGCKFDVALVFVGPQGIKKSTFFEALAGPWFGDSRMDIENKDSVLQLHATWIYEWGEIEEVTSRKQVEIVKKFLTIRRDLLRPPYARGVDFYPRSGVIVGTTNTPEILNDPTGDRRFWVIEIDGEINIDLLRTWRDQLWAEAAHAYRAKESWWLEGQDETDRAEDARAHHVHDPWEPLIARWLDEPARDKPFVTTVDVLIGALGMRPGDIRRDHETRVGVVMRSLRWSSYRPTVEGRRARGYLRPGGNDPEPDAEPSRAGPTGPTPVQPVDDKESGRKGAPVQPVQPDSHARRPHGSPPSNHTLSLSRKEVGQVGPRGKTKGVLNHGGVGPLNDAPAIEPAANGRSSHHGWCPAHGGRDHACCAMFRPAGGDHAA